MKILNDLGTAKGFDTFICATFDTDLPWFEALLLRQLRRRGVRRFLLFVDHGELAEALKEQVGRLVSSGLSYVIQTVKVSGSFHPKILLLTGEKSARLYIGSGNLSKGGLDRNLEVFERWDTSADNESVPRAFGVVSSYLYQLLNEYVKYVPSSVQEIVKHAFSADVFRRPEATTATTEIWGSPGSLFDRIERPAAGGHTLRIVSPFFDEKGALVTGLANRLGVSSFQVITDLRKTNLTPEAGKAIQDAGGSIQTIDPEKHSRPLHAKLFHAAGADWQLGAFGSPNASIAAWHGYNSELVVIRRDEEAQKVASLIDELQTTDLSSDDWQRLERLAAAEAMKRAEALENQRPTPPEIVFAEWKSLSKVQIVSSLGEWEALGVEFAGNLPSPGESFSSKYINDGHMQIESVCPATIQRDRVTAVRLVCGDEVSGWAVVHDPEEIHSQARVATPEREKLEELLGSEQFDPDGAQRLVELYSSILRKRMELRQKAQARQKVRDDDESPTVEDDDGPDWRLVTDEDFLTSAEKRDSELRQDRHTGILSLRLMKRLLFGDSEDIDINDTEGESEQEEEDESDRGTDDINVTIHVDPHLRGPKPTPQKRELFLDAAQTARQNYLDYLGTDVPRSPDRLLEDLQILAAPLHYMLRGGGMGPGSFRTEMILLLRAFLGGPHSPFVQAVLDLTEDARSEFWHRFPALLLVNLLLYNTCLANVEADLEVEVSDDFAGALPVLWVRHLIRTVPPEVLEDTEAMVQRSLPMLRWGAFWIGECFPTSYSRAPFQKFVKAMVTGSQVLDSVDHEFDKSFASFVGRNDIVSELSEDEPVVVRTERGTIGVGWVEDEQALVYDGAFQFAEARSHLEPMTRSSLVPAVPLSLLEDHASALGNDVREGLAVLRRISDGI